MAPQDSEFWTKARRARDQLAGQFLSHPEVTLIDLSYEVEKGKPTEQLVLRVHVRQRTDQQSLGLPEEVDGFPVRVVVGDYRLQSGHQSQDKGTPGRVKSAYSSD